MFTCALSPGPESSGSALYLRGSVSTSLMASMVTSLGSTANSDVTYMMMDFLSGSCTATSEEGWVGCKDREIRDTNQRQRRGRERERVVWKMG